MKFSTILLYTSLAVAVSAHELPSRYAQARRGLQFTTGPCQKDSECSEGCCGFNNAKCAGPAFAQEAFGGCGHGEKTPNCNQAAVLGLAKGDCVKGAVNALDLSQPAFLAAAKVTSKLHNIPIPSKPDVIAPPKGAAPANDEGKEPSKTTSTKKAKSTSKSKSKSKSKPKTSASKTISSLAAKASPRLFVTASCKKDGDCQQGCCAFDTGKCAGPGIAQTRDGGCGRGEAKPNCDVAEALKLDICAKGATKSRVKDTEVQQAAAFVSILDKLPFTPA